MLNYDHFAISLARAVSVLREKPHAGAEQKSALRALVALITLAPAVVTLEQGQLSVEGTPIPLTLPLISQLSQRLTAHGVTEIRFSRKASAADLLRLLRALAAEPGAVNQHSGSLQQFRSEGISVLAVPVESLAPGRRPVSVTEAFQAIPEISKASVVAPGPPAV